MLDPNEERHLREGAYVPEHSAGLMAAISGGEPFLIDDCLVLAKDDWALIVGYPLGTGPGPSAAISPDRIRDRFRARRLLFIGPSVPEGLRDGPTELDRYYRLDLDGYRPPPRMERVAARAAAELDVERTAAMDASHRRLIADFLADASPEPRVRGLYESAPEWMARCPTLVLLGTRNRQGKLAAIHLVDTAPAAFVSSILGCRSRKPVAPYASDLLMAHLIGLARERGKHWINLGLGVNEGIRRFKRKWGGEPFLDYACGEQAPAEPPSWLACLRRLGVWG